MRRRILDLFLHCYNLSCYDVFTIFCGIVKIVVKIVSLNEAFDVQLNLMSVHVIRMCSVLGILVYAV